MLRKRANKRMTFSTANVADIRLSFLDELPRTDYWRERDDRPHLASLTPYVVDDIRCGEPDGPNVILLLESPHTVEVCRGHPLAGQSGADVTKALRSVVNVPNCPDDCPFGEVLQEPAIDDRLKRFSVMNVSQLPMQSAAYLCPVRRAFDAILFSKFKTLRQPGAVNRVNRDATKEIKCLLIEDLKNRIQLTRSDAFFVPCGQVARDFFANANVIHRQRQSSLIVPHPSRGQWRYSRNRDVLCQLRNEISGVLSTSH